MSLVLRASGKWVVLKAPCAWRSGMASVCDGNSCVRALHKHLLPGREAGRPINFGGF
uniref:Uncharacterized protein n=1 Tax=Physcomitrium patens TaxID=3218 RepID=A0A2K1L9Z9_PHYPA|nr:hypothetical protein PHYPA_001276 [Physcomitrium patens]